MLPHCDQKDPTSRRFRRISSSSLFNFTRSCRASLHGSSFRVGDDSVSSADSALEKIDVGSGRVGRSLSDAPGARVKPLVPNAADRSLSRLDCISAATIEFDLVSQQSRRNRLARRSITRHWGPRTPRLAGCDCQTITRRHPVIIGSSTHCAKTLVPTPHRPAQM
jgi:hypothetical protein